ncbi:helix-turn-helix domain-containing protein [Kineococcus rubinsiae]|uniref:helix-turn-helix domain-containing protein n=1 Tax=Kineococcus rubinsiae TaxID=2609562 RepID=UPI00143093F8|nr:AraC family transcriptional regulator [Kineococcus rubinsiae]NIZ93402.1 AraC family transcriptional regulator [Kineococcus rubinsiae]
MSRSTAAAPAPRWVVPRAVREVVPPDPALSARWHVHDYPGPFARWNHHPEYEVHLARAGAGSYIVGDSVGRFQPGQLVLVGPDVPHDWISDLAPGEVLVGRDVVFQFHGEWLQRCELLLPELAALAPLWSRARSGVEFSGGTARAGARELELIGTSAGAERLQHIFALFALMAAAPPDEHRLVAGVWTPPVHDPTTAEVVSRALADVVADLAGPVRLSAAAATAGMSESAFSRCFQRATGQTFSDVVRKLRLAHAATLLEQTTRPVSEIAGAVGFANLSNFNRRFLAGHGVTPSAHRAAHRRSLEAAAG